MYVYKYKFSFYFAYTDEGARSCTSLRCLAYYLRTKTKQKTTQSDTLHSDKVDIPCLVMEVPVRSTWLQILGDFGMCKLDGLLYTALHPFVLYGQTKVVCEYYNFCFCSYHIQRGTRPGEALDQGNNQPHLVRFVGDLSEQVFVAIEQELVLECKTFTNAIFTMLAVHFVFNLEYNHNVKDVTVNREIFSVKIFS